MIILLKSISKYCIKCEFSVNGKHVISEADFVEKPFWINCGQPAKVVQWKRLKSELRLFTNPPLCKWGPIVFQQLTSKLSSYDALVKNCVTSFFKAIMFHAKSLKSFSFCAMAVR